MKDREKVVPLERGRRRRSGRRRTLPRRRRPARRRPRADPGPGRGAAAAAERRGCRRSAGGPAGGARPAPASGPERPHLGERGAGVERRSTSPGTPRRSTSSATTREFTETLLPLFEFLYTVWWRVEAAGVENVPAEGRGPHRGQPLRRAALGRPHGEPGRAPRAPRAAASAACWPWTCSRCCRSWRPLLAKSGRGAGQPGERRAPAAPGRAGRRVPRRREGRGQAVQAPLQAGPLRPRRVRAPGAAHRRAHRPVSRWWGPRRSIPSWPARTGWGSRWACRTSPSRRRSRTGAAGRRPAADQVVDRLRGPHRRRAATGPRAPTTPSS